MIGNGLILLVCVLLAQHEPGVIALQSVDIGHQPIVAAAPDGGIAVSERKGVHLHLFQVNADNSVEKVASVGRFGLDMDAYWSISSIQYAADFDGWVVYDRRAEAMVCLDRTGTVIRRVEPLPSKMSQVTWIDRQHFGFLDLQNTADRRRGEIVVVRVADNRRQVLWQTTRATAADGTHSSAANRLGERWWNGLLFAFVGRDLVIREPGASNLVRLTGQDVSRMVARSEDSKSLAEADGLFVTDKGHVLVWRQLGTLVYERRYFDEMLQPRQLDDHPKLLTFDRETDPAALAGDRLYFTQGDGQGSYQIIWR